MIIFLCPKSCGWFSRHFHLFYTKYITIKSVINISKILQSWSLSNSGKFIKNWTMTNTYPTLIWTQIRNRYTSQMCTNSRYTKYTCIKILIKINSLGWIQKSCRWLRFFLFYFLQSKSSYKNWLSIPNYLHNFSRRQTWYINFQVSISIISLPTW